MSSVSPRAAGRGLLLGCAALLLAGGAGRLAYIETRHGDELRRQAARQQTAFETIPAQRGDIIDVHGRVLAGSTRRPSVFADPALIADYEFAAHSIAPVLGLEARALVNRLVENRDRRFLWIKREISDQELAAFEQVRKARRLNGFVVRYEPRREYPHDRLASHVLGFVGAEQHGLAGIEQEFDKTLAGADGRRTWTVDTRRNRIDARAEEYVPPRDGASLVLTIDSNIQSRTEHHLRNAVTQFKSAWGAAVVMDPQSGEVLAMANHPDFSPAGPIPDGVSGAQLAAAQELLINRCIAGAYEPGSMFKPFIVGPAIEDGLTRMGETYAINGPTRDFGGRTIHDTHTYGTLTLEEVISKSSNIGMGILGGRCGNARLHSYVRRFGFGDPTGIALPGEHAGLVQDFSRWTSYSTHSVPIGQEIAITPLQLVTAFSVYCNGGVLYRPRVVRGVIDAEGRVLQDYSRPIPVRRVLDERVADDVRHKALVLVVTDGTGDDARTADWQVLGKTGTAQIANPNGRGYLPNKYMGSFVGAAPSDYPRVVVVVSIFMPTSGQYYGGTVAAPAVGAIIADTLTYMRVPSQLTPGQPQLSRVRSQQPED